MGKYQKVNNVPGGVMAEYFATMRQFLATQEAVMTGYLSATPGAQSERLDSPRQGLLEAFMADDLPPLDRT